MILSVFPGIDILGKGFEEEGYCVVRGPDLLWGGDIRSFHPPAGVFEGVIGGDPCQWHSALRALVEQNGYKPRFPDMTPEFVRMVTEAQPTWFLRENVRRAPDVEVYGYQVTKMRLDQRWLGEVVRRDRMFWFGSHIGLDLSAFIDVHIFESHLPAEFATAGHGGPTPAMRDKGYKPQRVEDILERQGLPRDLYNDCPLTKHGLLDALGNAVPLPMARAVAKAVRKATETTPVERR